MYFRSSRSRNRLRRLIALAIATGGMIAVGAVGSAPAFADDPSLPFTTCTATQSKVVAVGSADYGGGSFVPEATAVAYQWNLDDAPIPGATGNFYRPVAGDGGHQLSVTLTASKSGYADCVATSADALVLKLLTPGTPVLPSFAQEGTTITVDPGTWPDGTSLSYQWTVNYEVVPGATGPSLLVTPDDINYEIGIRVTGSLDGYQTAASSTYSLGTGSQLRPQQSLLVTGVLTSGATLSVSGTSVWYPAAQSVTFQWTRDGIALPDATSPTYTTTDEDLGHTVTAVVTASREGYQDAVLTAYVSNKILPPFPAVYTPVIATQFPVVGRPITGSVQPWPGVKSYTWEWFADGTEVSWSDGFDGPHATFTPTPAMAGKVITARVLAYDATHLATQSSASQPTRPVLPGELVVKAPKIGRVNLNREVKVGVPSLPLGTTVAYQWLASGREIAGATASTYTPEGKDWHRTLRVRLTVSGAGYSTVTSTSNGQLVHDGRMTFGDTELENGETVRVGEVLHGKAVGWGPAGVTVHLVWVDGNDLSRTLGHGSTYTVKAGDYPGKIALMASASGAHLAKDDGLTGEVFTVHKGEFTASGPATISGSAVVGSTLTAHRGVWSPATGVTYTQQWYRQASADATPLPIPGATHSTYLVGTASLGELITVRITAQKSHYESLTAISEPTPEVTR